MSHFDSAISTTTKPHKSDMLNKLNPRIDLIKDGSHLKYGDGIRASPNFSGTSACTPAPIESTWSMIKNRGHTPYCFSACFSLIHHHKFSPDLDIPHTWHHGFPISPHYSLDRCTSSGGLTFFAALAICWGDFTWRVKAVPLLSSRTMSSLRYPSLDKVNAKWFLGISVTPTTAYSPGNRYQFSGLSTGS